MAVLALMLCAMPAMAVQADTITKQCSFKTDPGSAGELTDGDTGSYWAPSGNDAKLDITLPRNGAGYIVIEWRDEPTGYVFSQYDANRELITSVSHEIVFGGKTQVFEIDADARYVQLNLTRRRQGISEIYVYSAGELPAEIARWEAPHSRTDIMLVCAYPGDEFVTFGGLVPHYAIDRGNKVQIVYMTDMGDNREVENRAVLWALGMTNYPVYLELSGADVGSVESCLSKWGGKNALIGAMVATIRMCKPEVIVSHDIDSPDPRRKLTAMLMQYAIDAAADPDQYPESASTYGVWHVKKLYLLNGDEQVIDFDWSIPSQGLNGMSPIESASVAFSEYVSLRGKYSIAEVNGDVDTSVYGLEYSMLGDDERHDCFFENVPLLDTYVETAETPEPTAEPTAVPALVFSPEPTATENPQDDKTVDEFSANTRQLIIFICVCVGLILLICCVQSLIYHLRKRRRHRY